MNINHYSATKDKIVDLVLKQKGTDILQSISFISVCTHVPVIAVLFFVGERLNWPEDILKTIEVIKKAYNYGEIEGIPPGFPGRKE